MASETRGWGAEPWEISKSHPGDVVDGDGWKAAECWDPENAPGDSADVARRIVACVNACAGLSTEALESGALGKALDVAARIADLHAAAVKGMHAYEGCGTCKLVAALRALGRLP